MRRNRIQPLRPPSVRVGVVMRQPSATPRRLMAAAAKAAASDAKGNGAQSKSRDRKGVNIKGREFPGLPHLAELTQKTPSMYDDAGRKYYLYTEKTFPVLWQERGGNVAFNSDEVV